jgi:hypothetical protein
MCKTHRRAVATGTLCGMDKHSKGNKSTCYR